MEKGVFNKRGKKTLDLVFFDVWEKSKFRTDEAREKFNKLVSKNSTSHMFWGFPKIDQQNKKTQLFQNKTTGRRFFFSDKKCFLDAFVCSCCQK
jgi:hypothetical protein